MCERCSTFFSPNLPNNSRPNHCSIPSFVTTASLAQMGSLCTLFSLPGSFVLQLAFEQSLINHFEHLWIQNHRDSSANGPDSFSPPSVQSAYPSLFEFSVVNLLLLRFFFFMAFYRCFVYDFSLSPEGRTLVPPDFRSTKQQKQLLPASF